MAARASWNDSGSSARTVTSLGDYFQHVQQVPSNVTVDEAGNDST
jgi:hypothetical protein